jgi:SAM-dependent methyltransferase
MNNNISIINREIEFHELFEDVNSREFARRVFSRPSVEYINRLKQIGFEGLGRVLDAGCGFGQWAVALAQLNRMVISYDISFERISLAAKIWNKTGQKNCMGFQSSLDNNCIKKQSMDAIFCYSSIYYCDYKKVISNFSQILKRGGKLYLCSNGIGWYLYNLLNEHNPTVDFSNRQMAIDTIVNTISYYSGGMLQKGAPIIIPSENLEKCLIEYGFGNIEIKAESKINRSDTENESKAFFKGTYEDYEAVFEILCTKIEESGL